MKIKCSNNLINLARLFETSGGLFIYGSSVRKRKDVLSLACFLTVEEVFSLLENTPYIAKMRSAKNGVLSIICEGESYSLETIERESEEGVLAALKRKAQTFAFTIDALFYNIKTGELYDFFGGFKDLKEKVVKQINENTFESGEQVLNAIYLFSEEGFSFEESTLDFLNKNSKSLKKVDGKKKLRFFESLSVENKNALFNALNFLSENNLLKYMCFFKGYTFNLMSEDLILTKLVNNNSIKMFALYIDLYNFFNKQKQLSVKQFVSLLIKDFYRCSISQQREVLQIISAYFAFDKNNVRFFIASNTRNLETILNLFSVLREEDCELIANEFALLKMENAPLTESDLNISYKEIKSLGVEEKRVDSLLRKLLSDCILNPNLNKREKLIKQVIKYM